VDFTARILSGKATLTIEASPEAGALLLDTRQLVIQQVITDGEETAAYTLDPEVPYLGQKLIIPITPATRQVTIHYRTEPQGAALQWLTPEQTAGKAHPFLFTQSQAILARTWVPIQDSPGIRFTYDATIRVPEELLPLMSADNPQERNSTGVYQFRMDRPIPAYLLALAVGDVSFATVGSRTGVYAEPATLEKAAYEFAEMEKMLEAAERIYGEYAWGRYDLIVLPPSFPFGGMENPKLTFATPTILAGDRSLTSLVAHELAHSWSGNLVTNQTWNDFWLNEGFTVYFERRIMEELYGPGYAQMLDVLGYQDLVHTVQDLGPDSPDTQLRLNLQGRDPDEGVSDIAYEKGNAFLRRLEAVVGRSTWDAFVRTYFRTFAFQSMNTERFLNYLKRELPDAYRKVDVPVWVYGRGFPADALHPKSDRFEAVEKSVLAWKLGTPAKQLFTEDWSAHESLHFIRQLPDKMTPTQMEQLDAAFDFTGLGNAEMLAAWLLLVVRNGYEPAYPALEQFLVTVGRRKFLVPLYALLVKTPQGRQRAKAIYAKARPNYHSVATSTLDELLK
jgi:aminopeptidase N